MNVWTYTTSGREYTIAQTLGRETYSVYARGLYVGTADSLAGAPMVADAHAKRAENRERNNVAARQFESARADKVRAENALVWSLIDEAR